MAHLPLKRVRTIMRTTDGADVINNKAVYLVKVATELFIKKLTTESYNDTKGGKKINYRNLVNIVHGTSRYEFLEYMIPKKITVREFKQLLRDKDKPVVSSEEEDSDDEENDNADSSDKAD